MNNPLTAIDDYLKGLLKIAPFVNIMAPALVLVCGIGMVFAVIQVQKALDVAGKEAAVMMQATAQPKLNTMPLDPSGYMDAAKVLSQLNPSVKVDYIKEKDILQVSVAEPSQLPEWLYLLSTVQSYRKGLVWNATEICLKKCDANAAAIADLKAFTQKIAVQ